MPPKAAITVDSLDAASVKFILSALKSCTEFAPDWNQVAKEHDIKYAKNARPRFNAIVAKFGFKLQDKKIVQLGEEADVAFSTPHKATHSKKPKGPLSAKKRETEEEEEHEVMNSTKAESENEADQHGDGDTETV